MVQGSLVVDQELGVIAAFRGMDFERKLHELLQIGGFSIALIAH